MTLSEKILTSQEEFETLQFSWGELIEESGSNNLCTTWSWISFWCKYYLREDDTLYIHTYYNGSQLVGILPLYLKKMTLGYQLNFLAAGEDEQGEICSEFQDFIVLTDFSDEILKLFTRSFMRSKNVFSINLNNILSESYAFSWVSSLPAQKYKSLVESIGQRFTIPVCKDTPSQLLGFHSKNRRREAKKYIENEKCSCIHLTKIDDFNSFFTELADLHNKSWLERGITGAFEQEVFVNFHADFAKEMFIQNKLIMFKILLLDETIAVFYGIIDGEILHYYQSGIKRHKELPTVGIAMHIEALKIASEKNLLLYDLMKGKEDSYKKQLTKQLQEVFHGYSYLRFYFWLPYYEKIIKKIKLALPFS
ncbi:MAG: GNAT family N-acetyltransferase [Colwellia sp.]|nr:GNAT family N-acetyltransferase [Colwellia sp.]